MGYIMSLREKVGNTPLVVAAEQRYDTASGGYDAEIAGATAPKTT